MSGFWNCWCLTTLAFAELVAQKGLLHWPDRFDCWKRENLERIKRLPSLTWVAISWTGTRLDNFCWHCLNCKHSTSVKIWTWARIWLLCRQHQNWVRFWHASREDDNSLQKRWFWMVFPFVCQPFAQLFRVHQIWGNCICPGGISPIWLTSPPHLWLHSLQHWLSCIWTIVALPNGAKCCHWCAFSHIFRSLTLQSNLKKFCVSVFFWPIIHLPLSTIVQRQTNWRHDWKAFPWVIRASTAGSPLKT